MVNSDTEKRDAFDEPSVTRVVLEELKYEKKPEEEKKVEEKKVEEPPEVVADNWEDLLEEISEEEKQKEEKTPQPPPKQPPASKTAGKKKKKKGKNAFVEEEKENEEEDEDEEEFIDAEEGEDDEIDMLNAKLRAQRLVEEADMALADDLFGGCERPQNLEKTSLPKKIVKKKKEASSAAQSKEPLDYFPFGNLKELETFATKLCEAIRKTNVKSVAWSRFLEVLLRDMAPKMDSKDLATLGNKVSSFIQHKRTLSTANKNKNDANDKNPLLLVPMNNLKSLEAFAEKIATKTRDSQAKSVAWLRFFDLILPEIAPRMDAKDLTAFGVKTSSCIQQKYMSRREMVDAKRKPNDKGNLQKSYMDEMDLFYGDLTEEEEEEAEYYEEAPPDDDEFDEYMNKQDEDDFD